MKNIIKYVSLSVIIIIAVFGVVGGKAEAQVLECPLGFVCVPVTPNKSSPTPIPECPKGFQCTPYIQVLNPNGGESLIEGQDYTIRWNSYGLPETAKLFIHIFRSDGTNPGDPIVKDLPSTQKEYTWKVTTKGDWAFGFNSLKSKIAKFFGINTAHAVDYKYKIFVSASASSLGEVYDYSDDYFSIVSPSCYTFTANLRLGDENKEVTELQKFLIAKGFDIPNLTRGQTPYGYFGGSTKAALQKYQRSVGIEATGFFGPTTRAMVNAQCVNNQKPVINYLHTSSMQVGGSVNIYGSGFSNNMVVVINGKNIDTSIKPTYVSPDGTKMSFIVPSLDPGTYSISVTEFGKTSSNYVSLEVVSNPTCPKGYTCSYNPVITNIVGPSTILDPRSSAGIWTVYVTDPDNNAVNVNAEWGDGTSQSVLIADGKAQLSHQYSKDGVYTITFIAKDKDGLTSQRTTKVSVGSANNISEQVKCVFSGATTEQRCYTATDNPALNFSCSGIVSCIVNVSGPRSSELTWKSSCVNNILPITTIDGQTESINFNCKSTTVENFVDFLVTKSYFNANQSVGIRASIKGDSRNVNVHKWVLNISCSVGVTMPEPNSRELCNSQQVYSPSNVFGGVLVDDYLVLTVDAVNKGGSTDPNVTFHLTAYDINGNILGSDKERVPLGFTNPPIAICPVGYICAPIKPTTPQILGCPAGYTCTPVKTAPTVKVLTPNGGETIKKDGSPIIAKWSTTNMSSTDIISTIRLRAYPNGQEYSLISNTINDGGEIIVPTDIPAGAYTLEIKTYVNGVLAFDASDSYFKIVDVTQTSAVINALPFSISLKSGDAVQTRDNLNVRSSAGGQIIGIQPKGSIGVVSEGVVTTNGQNWYKVNYYSGSSGWSSADYLLRVSN